MRYMLTYQELLLDINNSNLKFEIDRVLTDIYNDKRLIESINKYKESLDETLKKEIYKNESFVKYKRLENEVNMLILKLNKIFKELEVDLWE